jgi:hypothetical protein
LQQQCVFGTSSNAGQGRTAAPTIAPAPTLLPGLLANVAETRVGQQAVPQLAVIPHAPSREGQDYVVPAGGEARGRAGGRAGTRAGTSNCKHSCSNAGLGVHTRTHTHTHHAV